MLQNFKTHANHLSFLDIHLILQLSSGFVV